MHHALPLGVDGLVIQPLDRVANGQDKSRIFSSGLAPRFFVDAELRLARSVAQQREMKALAPGRRGGDQCRRNCYKKPAKRQ